MEFLKERKTMFKNLTPTGKVALMLCIVLGFLLFAFPADAQEAHTKCHYEVTQVFEDGKLVSETKIRKCKEETVDSNRFDPSNNFGDYVKVKAVDLGMLGLLIHLAK